jgi:hypothetical protein
MLSTGESRHLFSYLPLGLFIGVVFLSCFTAAAQENAGSVKDLSGQAFAETSAARRILEPKAAILLGDHVGTGDQSRVTLLLGRDTTLRLGARGSVVIDRFLVDAGGEITLQSGPLMVEHPDGGSPEPIQIRSSYGLIAVRGTRVFAGPAGRALGIFVERGEVSVAAAGRTVILRARQGTSIARPGSPPAAVTRWTQKRIDSLFGSIR